MLFDTENDNKNGIGIEKADEMIKYLDRAEETPVYIFRKRGVQMRRRKIPGSKAIINSTTDDVVCQVSSRYNILQHETAFSALIAAVREIGLADTARFQVENDNNLARVSVTFPTVLVPTQTGERIDLGVRLTNSYNKTNSFHGEVYIRWPDTGVAAPWARVGVERMAKHHTTNSVAEIESGLVVFLQTVIDAASHIVLIIDAAANDGVVFMSDAQKAAFLRPVMVGQKHLDAVTPHIPDRTNRWDIYRAVVTYTSNPEDLTRIMRDNIADFAERRILEPKILGIPSISDAEIAEASFDSPVPVSS